VSIIPFLRGRAAFDPETVEAMSGAFTDACNALGLKDGADQVTELLAKHIIELALRGIRDKSVLYSQTMHEFKKNR
jgi:hypothetical protein